VPKTAVGGRRGGVERWKKNSRGANEDAESRGMTRRLNMSAENRPYWCGNPQKKSRKLETRELVVVLRQHAKKGALTKAFSSQQQRMKNMFCGVDDCK
jgi:hypothetical protein